MVGPNGCGSPFGRGVALGDGRNLRQAAARRRYGRRDLWRHRHQAGRNVAEVALGARHNGDLPAGFAKLTGPDEFEIVRRIERGQGSDYRIGGRSVRARDVQTLLADAASGANSPALVSQGRVSALINAKPTERRQVLEDAAGISGLHARRHEAELKLRAAEANLERLEDVLGAMQTQLANLKKQARQAVRYRELTEEIRRAEAVLLALRWQSLVVHEAEARANFGAADNAVRQAMLDVAAATTRSADCAAALPPLRKEEASRAEALAATTARRDALLIEERQLAAAIAEAERQAAQLGADRLREERLQKEAAEVDGRLAAEADQLATQAAGHPAQQAAATARLAEARAKVQAGEGDLATLTEQVAAGEAQAGALRAQKRDLEQRLATLDRRIADDQRRLDALPPGASDAEAIAAAAQRLEAAEKAGTASRDAPTQAEKARIHAEPRLARPNR